MDRYKELITYKKNGKIGIVVKRLRDSIINLNEIYLLDSLPSLWDEVHQNYKTVAVKLDDSWGIIDIDGKLLVEFKYDNIEIRNAMFITEKVDKYGLINDIGEIVAEPIYNKIEFSFGNDYAKVWTAENKVGYVSKKGLEYFKDK